MRESLTVLFCLLASFAVIFGRSAQPLDLAQAFSAYQAAEGRGDVRRAARYGELTLKAAQTSPLLDRAGIARLEVMVGDTQAKAGDTLGARTHYLNALEALSDGAHDDELSHAKAQLEDLNRVTADRRLRGPVAAASGQGG